MALEIWPQHLTKIRAVHQEVGTVAKRTQVPRGLRELRLYPGGQTAYLRDLVPLECLNNVLLEPDVMRPEQPGECNSGQTRQADSR